MTQLDSKSDLYQHGQEWIKTVPEGPQRAVHVHGVYRSGDQGLVQVLQKGLPVRHPHLEGVRETLQGHLPLRGRKQLRYARVQVSADDSGDDVDVVAVVVVVVVAVVLVIVLKFILNLSRILRFNFLKLNSSIEVEFDLVQHNRQVIGGCCCEPGECW